MVEVKIVNSIRSIIYWDMAIHLGYVYELA